MNCGCMSSASPVFILFKGRECSSKCCTRGRERFKVRYVGEKCVWNLRYFGLIGAGGGDQYSFFLVQDLFFYDQTLTQSKREKGRKGRQS